MDKWDIKLIQLYISSYKVCLFSSFIYLYVRFRLCRGEIGKCIELVFLWTYSLCSILLPCILSWSWWILEYTLKVVLELSDCTWTVYALPHPRCLVTCPLQITVCFVDRTSTAHSSTVRVTDRWHGQCWRVLSLYLYKHWLPFTPGHHLWFVHRIRAFHPIWMCWMRQLLALISRVKGSPI